jgi:hypothetical protein
VLRGRTAECATLVQLLVATHGGIYFNEVDEGNHFAAWQEPDLFTTELRAAFRSLRDERRSS